MSIHQTETSKPLAADGYGTITELDFVSCPLESSLEVERHLLRLTAEVLQQRFGAWIDNAFIKKYVKTLVHLGARLYVIRIDGIVRGIAELHLLDSEGRRAEAAFSVESDWQGRGIGTRLMARLVEAAIINGHEEILLCCDSRNRRMRAIAERFGGSLIFEDGECTATIQLRHFVPESLAQTCNLFQVIAPRVNCPEGGSAQLVL